MKVPNPAPQIAPQPNPTVPRPAQQRRLDAADLADLTPARANPESPARAPTVLTPAETRPMRPGSFLDIKV